MPVRPAILTVALPIALLLPHPAPAQQPPSAELESSAPAPAVASPTASPAVDLRQSQLEAARANATVGLRETVRALDLGRGLRVGDLVDRTNADADLDGALATARPLGGPRWIDEQTCQVRLIVPGSAVADAVGRMLGRYPGGHPPVRTEVVNRTLGYWRRTSFQATGSSVAGGSALEQARPRQSGGRWGEVTDDTRGQTVARAHAEAVKVASDELTRVADPLPLGPHARAADALARPAVAHRVRLFLDAQPVTHIEFLDDLSVAVSVSVDAPGLSRVVQRAVSDDQPRLSATAGHAGDWDRLRAAVERCMPASVTGTAVVPAAPAPSPPPSLPAVVLPLQPPDWVEGDLVADATAAPPPGRSGSPLKVKAQADAAAAARLRDQLLAVRIGPKATLADAAKVDPQIAEGVRRVLLDARENRVEYRADGSVAVSVYLNLRNAWDQLRSNP